MTGNGKARNGRRFSYHDRDERERDSLSRSRQALRRRRRGRRTRPRGRGGRVLRPARAERGGQDDDRRDPRGADRAGRRHGRGAGLHLAARTARRCASGSASSSRRPSSPRSSPCVETISLFRSFYERGRDAARGRWRCVQLEEKAQRLGAQALGRPEAAPVARLRARLATPRCCSSTSRRPGSIRSRGCASGTSSATSGAARRHRAADHALHGGGRARCATAWRSSITGKRHRARHARAS